MALLQIAEPGQSSAPHEHKLAAGIDLGFFDQRKFRFASQYIGLALEAKKGAH